ncbi:MAG: hypothetical protein ABIH57_03270 [Candidatus Omnitrophota bacterium]
MKKIFVFFVVCVLGLMFLTESFAAINTEMMTIKQKRQIEAYKSKIADEEAPAAPEAKMFYIAAVAAVCVSILLAAMLLRAKTVSHMPSKPTKPGER